MTIDPGALYHAARVRISALMSGGEVDPDRRVPATPAWRVHDVVSHLAGVAEDAVNGNLEGAPGEAWTAAQVARGAGKPIAELLAQWGQHGPLIEAFLASPAGASAAAAVFDVHTHEADLRHAMGQAVSIPDEFLTWVGPLMSERFHTAVAEAGLPPVSLDISDREWFRGRLGRRSEAEVRAYPWSADPAPYLDTFFIFGRAEHSLGEQP